ncbi:hypothetical protein ZIOFF_008648 [Zingiber officinale]|uniref:OCRE domain-containing protein n=1 Tax=Zingiber officinale TaxID=94328 RepID=A0A8J5LQX0_ZINOF|nr:hypothetical protein ZIOFF_008648 [Zingiber officinale]
MQLWPMAPRASGRCGLRPRKRDMAAACGLVSLRSLVAPLERCRCSLRPHEHDIAAACGLLIVSYYYSSSLGYYYDPTSGMYCSATTGTWYTYDEQSGTYTEIQSSTTGAEDSHP